MKRALLTCLVLSFGAMLCTGTSAQTRSELERLFRVRVTAYEGPFLPVTGILLPYQADDDSLRIHADDGSRHAFSLTQTMLIERSLGRNHALWGLAGGILGMAVGGAIGGATARKSDGSIGDILFLHWEHTAVIAIGATTGLVMGSVIGALSAPERWVQIGRIEQSPVTVSRNGSLVVSLNR
jgi:MFS family permease